VKINPREMQFFLSSRKFAHLRYISYLGKYVNISHVIIPGDVINVLSILVQYESTLRNHRVNPFYLRFS